MSASWPPMWPAQCRTAEQAAALTKDGSQRSHRVRCLISERMTASGPEKVFTISPEYVRQMVASIVKDNDLSRYIL